MSLLFILFAIFFSDVSCRLVNDVDVDKASGALRQARWKRQGDDNTLSEKEIQNIVDKHNAFRSATKPSAANMQYMTYDKNLAAAAEAWAAQCKWYHSGTEKGQGQNLWMGSGEPTGPNQVTEWHNEKSNYNFETKACSRGKPCDHYKQVVWHNSVKVGCGKALCPTVYKQNGKVKALKRWIFNCHYSPGGNIVNERPFRGGPPCTQCPNAANTHCFENQCRDCDGEGISGCDCNMICENCGKRIDSTCSCDCLNFNHYEDRCQTKCADKGKCYNGWWPQNCKDNPAIPQKCPNMCGVCEIEDPPGDCSASTRPVRLVGGSGSWEGRLEVQLMTDTWGTVCKRNFGTVDAKVVCRQLGFPGVIGTEKKGAFGVGTLPITMFEVACTGSEDYLASCPHSTEQLKPNTCNHKSTDVVGIRCAHD